jgi:hypothetical protein
MFRVGALTAVAAAFLFLLVAPSASAGWAGSPYEKSQCTLSVNHNGRPSLYCERTFIEAFQLVDEFTVADLSCPSGQRSMRRVQTFEWLWRSYDFYDGPVPLRQFNFGGNETPAGLEQLISDVTTALGCAP